MIADISHFLTHVVISSPLHGDGYQFWSGIGSDVTELGVVWAIYAWVRQRNCHVKGCWRVGHPDDEAGNFPACRHHHSARHLHGKIYVRPGEPPKPNADL